MMLSLGMGELYKVFFGLGSLVFGMCIFWNYFKLCLIRKFIIGWENILYMLRGFDLMY